MCADQERFESRWIPSNLNVETRSIALVESSILSDLQQICNREGSMTKRNVVQTGDVDWPSIDGVG